MRLKGLFFVAMLINLLTVGVVMGQEAIIKGTIVDASTKSRVALAEVTNIRTQVTVGSNDMGYFQIKGLEGDTLLIQKRYYSPQNIISIVGKELVIRLMADVNSIEQVNIKGTSKKAALDEIKNDYKAKGSFYGGKPPVLAFVFQPLTALYELFGKTPKNARRFGKYYQNEMQQSVVDQHFSVELVTEHTALEGKPLEDFMVAFRPEYEKARQWTHYDAVAYIEQSFKKYKENPEAYKSKLIAPEIK